MNGLRCFILSENAAVWWKSLREKRQQTTRERPAKRPISRRDKPVNAWRRGTEGFKRRWNRGFFRPLDVGAFFVFGGRRVLAGS